MPGHTLQRHVAPCKNVHSATENMHLVADSCKKNKQASLGIIMSIWCDIIYGI